MNKLSICLITILIGVSIFTRPLLSQETSTPDTLTAEGRYVMGDRDSRNDAKEYALLDAKRKILEQAGTFLRSSTTIENYQLTEQEIKAYTAGFLQTEILEERFEPMGETQVAIVKIRAVVNPEEVAEQLSKMEESDRISEDVSNWQKEFERTQQELESLSADDVNPNKTSQHHHGDIIRRMQELDLLTSMAVEARRNQPNLKKLQAQVQMFQRLHPRVDFVRGYLGVALFKHGKVKAAVDQLEKAVQRITPKHRMGMKRMKQALSSPLGEEVLEEMAFFHYYLAKSYHKLGRKALAIKHLRTARKLNPTAHFEELP
ncbi:MAG: tetratricopeptide repeat protein [Methanobacteriota archaeon]|nr:MAG: tetratricopeptide repeat protein [Euryarchaeota archaeon]